MALTNSGNIGLWFLHMSGHLRFKPQFMIFMYILIYIYMCVRLTCLLYIDTCTVELNILNNILYVHYIDFDILSFVFIY